MQIRVFLLSCAFTEDHDSRITWREIHNGENKQSDSKDNWD
jgi:hypothetical protein